MSIINPDPKLPETEQGLMNFIAYAKREIKRCGKKTKELNELIDEAENQLTLKGNINAKHIEAVQIPQA